MGKKKRFKLLSLLLISLIIISLFGLTLGVFAEEVKSPPFTLPGVVKIALEQGNDMRKALLELQQSEVNYRQTKADLLLHPSILSELSNETARLVAQRNYEIAQSNQTQVVEESYYDILKLQRAVILAQENITRSQKQLENVRAKFSLGMVAQIDVLSAELELSKAQSDLNNTESNLQLARMRFNRLLGKDLNTPVELASELTFEPSEIDLDKSIEYALTHRLEIKKAEDDVVLKTKEVEVNTNDFTPLLVQKKSQIGLQLSKASLEDVRANIILEIKQNYESLKTAERAVPLQEKNLVKANESLKIAEARFDAGVITSIELIDARNDAYQAENSYLQAVYDYNVAKAKFYNSLGMSLEERMKVFSEDEHPQSPQPQEKPDSEQQPTE